ncbi:MAG: hypothetical protein LCH32_08700 [Bacteroidetes bacterium]|nr:hypothetical protein [Bacteroidota bacterium]
MKFKITILFYFIGLFTIAQTKGWEYVGPKTINQQVKGYFASVWVDTTNSNYVLAGTSSGGLFISKNANDSMPNWLNLMDNLPGHVNGVSDIVVFPNTDNKTIFVSTLTYCGGMIKPQGFGILKTTDEGKNWQNVGPQNGNSNPMFGLVIHPSNPNQMLAYSQHSLYITFDAWETFKSIDIGLKPDAQWFFSDAEFAPHFNNKLYICTRTNNKNEAKIFEINTQTQTSIDITPKDVKASRIEVETLLNPKYKGKFYIAFGTEVVNIRYFNGTTFTKNLNEPFTQTHGITFWNFEFRVNQQDTNIMYVGLTECSRSIDGGKTFQKIANYNMHNMHADVRGSFLLPNNKLYIANDGGISLLADAKNIKWKSLNGYNLDANQFFGSGVLQSDSLFIVGGTQDDGGFFITENKILNNMYQCGDGYHGEVLDKNNAIINCNGASSYLYNITNGAQTYIGINEPHYGKRELMVVDSFIYTAYHNVWRANINKLLSGNLKFENVTNIKDVFNKENVLRNKHINSYDIKTNGECIVAYGLPNWEDPKNIGKLYYYKNVFTKTEPIDLTEKIFINGLEINRWFEINAIKFSKTENNKFYFSAFDYFDNQAASIYEATIDYENENCTLKQINANLPKTGISCIKLNEFNGDIYIGTHAGVYYKSTNDSLWTKLSFQTNSMPNVMVFDIDFNYQTNTLYASTHGRGIWRCQIPSNNVNNLKYGTEIINKPTSVNGQLIVSKKSKLELNNKLFLYPNSSIYLNKKSTLIINKNLLRNNYNEVIDINKVIIKNKRSKLILK